jgi:hypothetical protein
MVLESLLVLMTLAAPREASDIRVEPGSLGAAASPPAYSREARAVDNWRLESAFSLDLPAIGALRQAMAANASPMPRCVKLNNYWCVKHAGWNGEIAADAEGHVAFSRAQDGAAVAAQLLKRYYLELNRRTAREIASRWAPAQCFAAPVLAAAQTSTGGAGSSRMLPQRPLPMGLAPMGLANTLRGRWLAAHRLHMPQPHAAARAGLSKTLPQKPAPMGPDPQAEADAHRARWLAEHRVRLPPSSLPAPTRASALALAQAPEIAQGMGEPTHRPPAAQKDVASASPAAAAPDCSAEFVRIDNYAARIAEGVVGGPDQDLALFDSAGQPTDNLAKVMANMAAVEIGPYKTQPALIARAVDQLRRSAAARTAVK